MAGMKIRVVGLTIALLVAGCTPGGDDTPDGPSATSSQVSPEQTTAPVDEYFAVSPFVVTEGEDFPAWEFDLTAFDGVDNYKLRFTQGERSFDVETPEARPVVVTGDDFASADFDYGIEADLELFHGVSGEPVARYDDLFPLPVPADELIDTVNDKDDPFREYEPFPTDENGQVLLDEEGSIIGATDFSEFEERCAVLDPRLRINRKQVKLSGFWPKSTGLFYESYLWVPEGWEINTKGTITPVPWPTNVEEWNNLPVKMQLLVTTGIEHSGPQFFEPWYYHSLSYDDIGRGGDILTIFGGLPVSKSDEGRYVPVGVRALITSQYQYDLVVKAVPKDENDPAPYVDEPCLVFQNMFIELAPDLGIFTTIAEVGVGGAQLVAEFTPGYDCYDAAVNGVDGWNAAGCTADLVGGGTAIAALKTADNVQFVARRGDDVVGAIKGVDGSRLADDLVEASAKVCGSFGADVNVVLADGSTVPISMVESGDRVLSWDDEGNRVVASDVTSQWSHLEELTVATVDGSTLAITADHVVWNETDDDWQAIDEFDVGDRLLTADDGNTVVFEGLLPSGDGLVEVFDLAVADSESFFVVVGDEQVLVHNMPAACDIARKHGGSAGRLVDEFSDELPELARTVDDFATANPGRRSVQNLDQAVRNVKKQADDAGVPFDVNRFNEFISKGGDDAAVLLKEKGLRALDTLCAPAAGGAYELVDVDSGNVIYVGETNDFARREMEHLQDARFENVGSLELDPIYEQRDYDVRRGLEQSLYDQRWGDVEIVEAKSQGSLNRQRPMASRRTSVLETRRAFARAYLKIC